MPDETQELKQRGVFCIETVWYGTEDKTSMRPVLEALRDSYMSVPVVYRSAVTQDELKHNLMEWKSLDARQYPILYLGYHGEAESIVLGERGFFGKSEITIEQLAQGLAGECKDRVVHFGSCSTLDVDDELIEHFLNQTGASAISGYRESVEWTESVAFDVLYIQMMQYGGGRALTPNVMKSIRDGNTKRWGLCQEDGRYGRSPYFDLGEHLGFKLEIGGGLR